MATSAFGAIAGAVVISGQRSVLTTGVMITLALIPSMGLVGVAASTFDFALAAKGALRWTIDALLVIVANGVVFALKRKYVHRRSAVS